MNSRLPFAWLPLFACSSSSTTPPPPPPPPTVVVSPAAANVLTCSKTQMTATVTGATDTSVTWTASPGTIDQTGLYSSPIATPNPASATVTATSVAAPDVSGDAQLALATAFPGAAKTIPNAPGNAGALGTVGVYQHYVVARGTRAYAIWPVNPAGGTSVALHVARSDDGGATWNAGVDAISATLKSGTTTTDSWIECPALAIDAGNPDVIYATGRLSGGNSLGAGVGQPDDPVLAYAVSTDGGATFTTSVLHAEIPIGYCADVVSPAANAVVIADPVDICGKDIWLWSDSARGAGFAQGGPTSGGYLANGTTGSLDMVDGRTCGTTGKVNIEQNGTVTIGGEATEAPRLFTNGTGRVCISYVGDTSVGSGATPIHSFVQCSDDLGVTFSQAISLDPTSPYGVDHSQANGTFGPNGAAAIAWVRALDVANETAYVFVATSTNGGQSFSAAVQVPTYALPGMSSGAPATNPTIMYDADGILWLAYRVYDGGVSDRIVVDKSCDGGTTWSGAVLVNGTEAQITASTFTDMKWPVIATSSGDAPHISAAAGDHTSVFSLAP